MDTLLSGFDALLISNPTNIRYLTGFEGANPEEHEVFVLMTPSRAYLFTNSLYIIRAKECKKTKNVGGKEYPITVVQISRTSPIEKAIAKMISEKHIRSIGFESSWLSVGEFEALKKQLPKTISLIHADGKIEAYRKIKTADEITVIKKSCALADACYTHLLSYIKIGIRETDIAWEITAFFHSHGADNSFAPVVAFGKHAAEPHAMPSHERVLKPNEPILIDFGASVSGYKSDMTRMIPAKNPTAEWIRAYNAVFLAQKNALSAIRNGERSGAILDQLAKSTIKDLGFIPYSHSLGHSIGLSIHENPRLTIKNNQTLQEGEIVSIEPGIYMEGKFGIRIEDLILITKDGYELLSHAPKILLS
jgi:Xaa-Pro aminopeptidase